MDGIAKELDWIFAWISQ